MPNTIATSVAMTQIPIELTSARRNTVSVKIAA